MRPFDCCEKLFPTARCLVVGGTLVISRGAGEGPAEPGAVRAGEGVGGVGVGGLGGGTQGGVGSVRMGSKGRVGQGSMGGVGVGGEGWVSQEGVCRVGEGWQLGQSQGDTGHTQDHDLTRNIVKSGVVTVYIVSFILPS